MSWESARREEHVLLSDVHLTERVGPEEAPPGWWVYKREESSPDRELVQFLEAIVSWRPSDVASTHLVMNGDSFDFDGVHGWPERRPGGPHPIEGMPPDVPGSVHKMRRIVAAHGLFLRALAEFLAAGNRVTFVLGNHDRELQFPEVREVLVQALVDHAPAGTGPRVADAVTVEPWFVHVPGVLYAEHGQQYDATCSYRDVLDPFIPGDEQRAEELELSFGSHTGRHFLSRLGTFNPYDDTSFLMSLKGYVDHFRTYYKPHGRKFLRPYVGATFQILRDTLGHRRRALRLRRPFDRTRYDAYVETHGVPTEFIDHVLRLRSRPIADRFWAVCHELWVDRFALLGAFLAVMAIGIASAQTLRQGLLLITLLPIFAFTMRQMGRGSLALQERGRWGLVAEQIAQRLRVPVVAFGHSHRPERRPLHHGGRYYNLGTWAPVPGAEPGSLAGRARRFLIVRPTQRGVRVVFERWAEGGPPSRRDGPVKPGTRPSDS